MRTITLTDKQVESLRYTLTKRDDWGISPVEYRTELMKLEHQLQQQPDPEQWTLADLDGTDDEATWLIAGHVLSAEEVHFLRGLSLPGVKVPEGIGG
jgi:hypothetical protein